MTSSFAFFDSRNWTSVLIFIVTFLFIVVFTMRRRRRLELPPGPVSLPVLGNIQNVLSSDMLGKLRALRQKYGDIYRIYFGQELTIILNGYDVIHDALVKKGGVFAVRPVTPFSDMVVVYPAIAFADGLLWKQQRSFAQRALQEFGFSSTANISIEERINQEVTVLVESLDEMNGSVDIKKPLVTSICNVITSIVYGRRFDYEDGDFKGVLNSMDEVTGILGRMGIILNAFPLTRFLANFPGDLIKIKRLFTLVEPSRKFFGKPFVEAIDNSSDEKTSDFAELFIKEMKEKESKNAACTLNETTFKSLCNDLLGAGTETSATTIRWLILYLLKHPDIQRKLHDQIDDVLGKDEQPSLSDRSRLPYVEATIMETMRIAPVVPLAIPHSVTHDVTLQGFVIPQNTSVLINLESVLKDPNAWKDPDEFRPERFLTEGGVVRTPKEFVPFSLGRRSCLGESLARMELFLYATRLLQRFEFTLPEGGSPPDTQGMLGITYSPKPFRVRLLRR